MTTKASYGDQTQSTPETAPAQTAPPLVDWQGERDAGHVWSALCALREKSGELSASVAACNVALVEYKGDLKDIDRGINELKTEQKSNAKLIKLIGFIMTPLVSAAALLAPLIWTKAMRPDLEKSIAATVKADIEKEAAAREKAQSYEKEIADLKAQLRRATRPAQ